MSVNTIHLTADEFEVGLKNLPLGRIALFRDELHKRRPTHPYTIDDGYDRHLRAHILLMILNRPVCSGCYDRIVVAEGNAPSHLCGCKTEWHCGDMCRRMVSKKCSLLNNGKWHYDAHLCFSYDKT